jgi:hypothetical protein
MVYEKSALGFKEFINQNRTLSVRERQVLLLINGNRNIDELEKFFKKEQLSITLNKLESDGYIHQYNSASSLNKTKTSNYSTISTLSYINSINHEAPLDIVKITKIKSILLESADDYLGLMGHNIKVCVNACHTEYDLRSCISMWHMAMRESKLGRESTSFLLEQIHQTLENKILEEDRNTH